MNFGKIKSQVSILIIAGFTLLTCVAAQASSPELWQISPEQKQNMQVTLQQANEQIHQIKAKNPDPAGAMQLKNQTKEIQAVRLKAIQKIQNSMPYQQQTAWNKFFEHGKENRKNLLKELDLSQHQRMKLVHIMEIAKSTAWEAAANPSLTLEEIQKQSRQQNQFAAAQIRALLKPGQQSKLDNWKQTHGKIFWLL